MHFPFVLAAVASLVCAILGTALAAQGNTCQPLHAAQYNIVVCTLSMGFAFIVPLAWLWVVYATPDFPRIQVISVYRRPLGILALLATLTSAITFAVLMNQASIYALLGTSWVSFAMSLHVPGWFLYNKWCSKKKDEVRV